jgi:hypothetical protein
MKTITPEYIPAQLIGQFDNISDAARAYSAWKEQHRRPGRPKTRDKGVRLSTLQKMVKA